ncbi:MAG: SIMPL domain-containing protein, partial [Aeromicrobium sp.]
VEVGGIEWNVMPQNRVEYEAEIRREAVLDAIAKAQAYADAIGAGQVEATHLSDPGMLGSEPQMPRAMMAAMADSLASGGFELVPAEIVVRADVDAHFKAH